MDGGAREERGDVRRPDVVERGWCGSEVVVAVRGRVPRWCGPPRDHPLLPCRHAGATAAAAGAGLDGLQFAFALVDLREIQREAAAGS